MSDQSTDTEKVWGSWVREDYTDHFDADDYLQLVTAFLLLYWPIIFLPVHQHKAYCSFPIILWDYALIKVLTSFVGLRSVI